MIISILSQFEVPTDGLRFDTNKSGLPMSSTVKREKGIGEEAWGTVGFWKVFWNAEEEGSPKGNASPPRQGPCRVGRLSFDANQRRRAIVIASKTTLASEPGRPPLAQSAAVFHLSQSS